ncbi:MAG: ribonuclease HII [Anaerolineales bacterium]
MITTPTLTLERALWRDGYRRVTGIDEAGRGALAGPVSAAVVILPPEAENLEEKLQGVRDSKQMTASQRQAWAERLPRLVLDFGVGFASPEEIDTLGILPATRLAVRRALENLQAPPDYLLLDYLTLPEIPLPQYALPKGDSRVLSIAAASIFAKTRRDTRMCALEKDYPGYGFARHKGYGTGAHREAISRLGASPIHRRTFAPLRAKA